jgi:hypothetical protein
MHTILRQFQLLFTPEQVASEIANTELFFILSIGRSGTSFLFHLLNQVPDTVVYHETKGDRKALVDAFWNAGKAQAYLSGRRERLVAARIIESRCRVYGETNSYLRHHVEALRQRWQPKILHLVRDGRDVVRSIMNRKAFTKADLDHTGRLHPSPDSPIAEEWWKMGRFERVCWYWSFTNHHLLQHNLPLVYFEEVLSSYEHFEKQVLIPLNLTFSPEIWCTEVEIPKNVSKETSFPPWEDWTAMQRDQFVSICGRTMQDLGYAL